MAWPIKRTTVDTHPEDSADRLAYLVLSYGLLLIVAYRGLVGRAPSWDLLGLVVLGGLSGTAYMLAHGGASARWLATALASALIAAAFAALLLASRS